MSALSDLEQILWDSLDINDGINFALEELVFKPAEKRPEWADNPDADGAALVQEAHYTNAYLEGTIRVLKAEAMDSALEAVGELIDALQSMERTEGGLPCPWTSAGSTKTLTWYALFGELAELPITPNGDLAGWFIDMPVLKFKLTLRPFGYREQRTVLEATSSTAPLQVVYLDGIEGDVLAEGILRVTDKAEQDRRYMEWGLDNVESAEGNPGLELKADEDLVVEGYAGVLAERSGSISAKVVEATLSPTAVVLCSTGPVSHIGSFRCKLRCQADGEGARFHISYRVGDGNWVTSLPWVEPGQVEQWFDQDQAEVFLEEAEQGAQVSEIRIEGKVVEAENCIGWLDVLGMVPTRRYGVAREPLDFGVPTNLLVSDSYSQASGNATGKTADLGGVYAALEKSATTDFTIVGGKLKRISVNDAGAMGAEGAFRGRAIGMSSKFGDVVMCYDFAHNSGSSKAHLTFGTIVNYISNTAFVAVFLTRELGLGWYLVVRAGEVMTFVRLGELSITEPSGTLLVGSIGETLYVYVATGTEGLRKRIVLNDPAMGAEGKTAIYDENSEAAACTREYDNLAIWNPVQSAICASGQRLDVRADAEEREDSTGSYWSPVRYRGAHCLLDPGRVNRIAVKMRRNETTEEPDASPTDEQGLEVLARERFLTPR